MSRYPEWLPNSGTAETPQKQNPSQSELAKTSHDELSPEYIDQAFQQILQEYQSASPTYFRRHPVRIERIWELFRSKNYHSVTLNELTKSFVGVANPQEAAQNTLSLLNRKFVQLGLEVEVERFTSYRLRFRKK